MSDTEPQFTLKQNGVFTRVEVEYTNDALDAMAQRAAERIEGELVQQILARLGYVKVVRCRDCRYSMSYWESDYCDYFSHVTNDPDGFCAWGERKEETE